MSKLFSPVTIKSVTFKNRIVMSPMCMYSSVDGFASDWHFVHYGTRAMGGLGTVVLEASAVRADGRISVGDLGIYSDEHIPGLQRIASFIKEQGAVPAIQLAHAGRKGSIWAFGAKSHNLSPSDDGGWRVVAPSPIPFSVGSQTPREMDLTEIKAIQQAFANAARRAYKAGFQMIELHSAHGYLLNEFLSPLTNQRHDEYGGDRSKRVRMLFETIEKVREEWPDELPICVRISATDWKEGGWTLEDSQWLSKELAEAGVDIVDVSSGGVVPDAKVPVGVGYQVPLAAAVKQTVGDTLYVGTVGLITSGKQAEMILASGQADFVFIGRELLRNPYFANSAANELHENIAVPPQYVRWF